MVTLASGGVDADGEVLAEGATLALATSSLALGCGEGDGAGLGVGVGVGVRLGLAAIFLPLRCDAVGTGVGVAGGMLNRRTHENPWTSGHVKPVDACENGYVPLPGVGDVAALALAADEPVLLTGLGGIPGVVVPPLEKLP
ncbi:MAG TPA: hypothetical protein VIJ12_11345 [Candidatus Baltobacteraceae bacterium]